MTSLADVSPQSFASPIESSEFQTWFKGSRVVDEAGQPLVMYHGTPAKDLVAFDLAKAGFNGRSEGAGIYFTSDLMTADSFKKDGKVIAAALNIKKPIRFDDKPFSRAQMTRLLKAIALRESVDHECTWQDGFLSGCVNTYQNGLTLDAAVQASLKFFLHEKSAVHQLGGLIGSGVSVKNLNRAVVDSLGFDGFYAHGFDNAGNLGGHIWIAMLPEQIQILDFDVCTDNVEERQADVRPRP